MVLPISEIFHTLQGEGPTVGVPSTFIRTAICNLHCVWCDAWYTWQSPKYAIMTYAQVNAKVVEVTPETTHQLVLTGGEPMIWGKEFNSLLEEGPDEPDGVYFDRIEVETNGTLMPADGLWDKISQFNVSLKLSNNQRGENLSGAPKDFPIRGDDKSRRIHPPVIKAYNDLPMGKSYFKFVIASPDDLEELSRLIDDLNLKQEKIILMPEGTDLTTLNERITWLSDVCKSQGWRLTPRLQMLIWGNTRGT